MERDDTGTATGSSGRAGAAVVISQLSLQSSAGLAKTTSGSSMLL